MGLVNAATCFTEMGRLRGAERVISRVAIKSVSGTRKSVNQDAYCYLEASTDFGRVAMAIVCDGVGGLSDGELASSATIKSFAEWFEAELPHYLPSGSNAGGIDLPRIQGAWASLLAEANAAILEYGSSKRVSLGTTFSGMLICGDMFLLAHVGDCRVYRAASGGVERLTADQTWVAQLVSEGQLTEEEALHHPQGNVIMQAIGSQPDLQPVFSAGSVHPGDMFAICCDGLYRDVPRPVLESAFMRLSNSSQQDMGRICEDLVSLSMNNGSTDNITILAFSLDDQPTSSNDVQAGVSLHSMPGADDSPTIISRDSRTVLVPSAGPTSSNGGVDGS